MKICEICGDEFQEHRSNQQYCKVCGKNSERARQHYAKAEYINRVNAGDLYKFIEKICKECGKKFCTSYGGAFCSDKCSAVYTKRKIIETAQCPICHTLLTTSGNFTGRGCCSEGCKQEKVLRDVEEIIRVAIEKGNYIPCEFCGKKFISKNFSNRFCSRVCFDLKIEEEKKKLSMKASSDVKKVHYKKCKWCGKPFTWRKESSGQKFCSEECRGKKYKDDKRKSIEKLNIGKDLNICTVCRTLQIECERFTSNFVYSPKGSVTKKMNDKYIIVSCPKFRE